MAQAQLDVLKQQQKSTLEKLADTIIQRVDTCYNVKPKQMEAIKNIFDGKDTLAILPTSYGKSMIYQMLPPLFCELENASNPIVLVVSPLKSLIRNQIDEVKELETYFGIKGCSLDDHFTVDSIKSGGFNMIFGIPEMWLSGSVKEMLSSKFFRRNLVCVVVDEAHKVAW